MFGSKRRRNDRLYWDGFRDALVRGRRNPSQPEFGLCVAEEPFYRRGFDDGKTAARRIHRDALVSEVRSLALGPDDKVVVKSARPVGADAVKVIRDTLKPHFPDHTVLVIDEDVDLLRVES